ncbi:three component ABC system middle component [Sinomicrobium weinanense]|uniref:Uncharacterized protein n=1 Tax=Sinomicrobium weinanense TaxID=2842200 RepID=A0A926JW18_9FLAO|nr:three component ABC system middle component [Sinomicrobium weinanense]MBC9798632.1 hypothetical protein [Sinomicrobium weinanense]MBU3125874.1 hypothetical protein [Sinomicrobium weinanense]
MNLKWTERNKIVANLFNPAFCGEIIRATAQEYNKHTNTNFPFAFAFLVLPIVLHKATRERMPRTVKTYFFVWVEKNDDLFFDFTKRSRSMVKYTKEALSFLLFHSKIEFEDNAGIIVTEQKVKKINKDDYQEYNEILKKAEMLGKWLSSTSDVKSIYSFLRITP